MAQKKYASLNSLQTFLDNLKTIFATKTEIDTKVNSSELSNYYTKNEIDGMEFITVEDIDTICGD